MAATLASLLGINAPTHAVGRVLTEALASTRYSENASGLDREGHDFSRAVTRPNSKSAPAAEVRPNKPDTNKEPPQ